MLPGFRFFVATIMLAASVLIFGLGAAALLRVTHEEVATAPSLRAMQPPLPPRPRQAERAPPTLALLRVEIPPPAIEEQPAIEETPAAVETASPHPAAEPQPVADANASAPASEPAPEAAASTEPPPSEAAAPPKTADIPSPAAHDEPAAGGVASVPETATVAPPQAAASTPEATPAPPPSSAVADTPPSPPAQDINSPPAQEAEAVAPAAPAQIATPIPPTPIAVGGDPATSTSTAPLQATTPEPTRVVAVTATGCEILPNAPGQLGSIPEAQASSQPAQDAPAPNDKIAKLDTPTATVPTPVARPELKAKTVRKRTVIRHRHHTPRARVVRREVVRPQPQPDLFTILFGGGQPMPATQPAR